MRVRIERLLRVPSETKVAVYSQVFESADLNSLNYWLEVTFAAGIATLGLVLNSPAVVIGAMLISPLMGPILAAGLALAAADLYLGVKSLVNLLFSVAWAIVFSAALTWSLPFRTATQEILNRTQPNLLDLGVAVFSGLAGSIVVCRGGGGGGVTALPGVAIAVALMPPLCTVGFGAGAGLQWQVIGGAALLFVTNLAAIVSAAFVVFFAVRMDAPGVRAEIREWIERHAPGDSVFRALGQKSLARSLSAFGKLRWRVLMLAVVLAGLYFPLRRSLMQVRDEAVTRAAIRDAVRRIAPAENVLSERITLSPEVQVRLILTGDVPAATVTQAEAAVARRTGKVARISVRKVAGADEVAELRQQMTAPPPKALIGLDALGREAAGRVESALNDLWPSESAPIESYQVAFSRSGTEVRVKTGAADIGAAAQEAIGKALAARLEVPGLLLLVEPSVPEGPPVRPSTVRAKARK